jgi:hypothetical protein
VIHRAQALSGITGRKEMRRRLCKLLVKYLCLTEKVQVILHKLRQKEEGGIPGGALKCVDIRRNTKCEGTSLVLF